ncbi:TetR/AcrR family transcriptional regulator [Kibdelosporangium philippinense]|uniref:TetR/AcrR family transcriptional regulator n=1 Tax=Kibdelosporangium philippinense TaxID=211113 RepID=A0ABS8ZUV8_9PSEU|nr:TetR/AcrR family transcriptional regulator [Kibdelosporangium philippinense]MCE7010406.1 TetR/AcrR family transcriptional regulator [Kibdelosporangium philippinense]
MNSPGGRSYHSPRREAQAKATRREILETARRLFREQGYAATSVPVVAREAGVSTKTVYLSFPTKRQLLLSVWDLALHGDDEQIPVADRDWFREMIDEPDPSRQLYLYCCTAHTKVRFADVLEVIRGAAAADPEIAELWQKMQAEFYDNQRRIVVALDEKGGLRPGLSVDDANDLLWTLNHPTVFHMLVAERGWSPEKYRDWLYATLRQQLLGE